MNKKNLKLLLLILLPIVVLIHAIFTSQPRVLASHSRVNLLTTDNFAVLGGSAVTGTNTNVVTGDVGLDPNGGADITLLTCSEVSGTIYDNNGGYTGGGIASTACRVTNAGLLTTAKNDLVTAYNDAAGRTTTSTVGTELGGTTLTDGTYDSAAGTFGITGTLTLNGQGNADAVFIFKMASTLITEVSSQVVLTNGAQACNVYWQVGSSATLGTSTTLVGNVLALTTITDNGSSTVNGRLLARNGAVTLNNTTLTRSTCAAGSAGAPTPTPTPTPTQSTSSSGGSASAPAAKICPALNCVTPIILESRRIDANSVFVSWGPYAGSNTFIIRYGLENGKWLYNTTVTGFSTTIGSLPSNQPIWVLISPTDGCSIGTCGVAKLVGGPMLPNSGFGPKNYISWHMPFDIHMTMSLLNILLQQIQKLSSVQ
jgi:hypothetical protein